MKTWVRASRSASAGTVVTVTVAEGNLSAKWSTKTTAGEVRAAVKDGRTRALALLAELKAAMAEIEDGDG